jgi:eukaryotic-like serine/threonine-protein kinase
LALTTGTRLGPYEILSPLGAGGMGEVYRARDTKLKRDVALKVLPTAFAQDLDRMARFQREAELLASLNHPNIAHIFGVEERALAMELVEGDTLASPLPIETTLNYAKQIAEALEYAHERGVIHRDLKPANVKVTPDGAVKLLDFGLARALGPGESGSSDFPVSHSPTLSVAATQAGMILGTAAYMSPEQANGRPVDRRTDIWSFGAVLYEMLSGEPAFKGESVPDVLGSVLKLDPDWRALPADTPPAIVKLVRRCLTKDRKQRLQAIGEARIAIEEAIVAPHEAVLAASASGSRRRPWLWVAASAALAVALTVPTTWLLKPAGEADAPLIQFEISPPQGITFGSEWHAMSPDGTRLALEGTASNGKRMLWLRSLDARAAAPIPGTDGGTRPFWSPDGRLIAFTANGKLQKISPSGGAPQVICDARLGGGTWNSEGTILFSETDKPIQRVSASGGVPADAIGFDKEREEFSQDSPQFLPDGRHYLYSSNGKERGMKFYASLDGTRRFLFTAPNSPVKYAPSAAGGGWLIFVNRTQLFARPFDADRGEFTGEATAVADSSAVGASFGVSTNGSLFYRHSPTPQRQLTWISRDGKTLGAVGDPGDVSTPRISPNQKLVAFTRTEQGNADIWVHDAGRANANRLTFEPGLDVSPVWVSDGRILYASQRGNDRLIVERSTDGLGGETVLVKVPATEFPLSPISITSNGLVLMMAGGGGTTRSFSLQRPEGAIRPLLPNQTTGSPSVSPDGRRLVYSSRQESGTREVFVETFSSDQPAATTSKRQISVRGGDRPVWRADGAEIFFLAPDGKLMTASVEARANFFQSATPQALFQTSPDSQFDVARDGQRFLISQPVEGSSDAAITVIVNWPKLLQK